MVNKLQPPKRSFGCHTTLISIVLISLMDSSVNMSRIPCLSISCIQIAETSPTKMHRRNVNIELNHTVKLMPVSVLLLTLITKSSLSLVPSISSNVPNFLSNSSLVIIPYF